ncbi:MAG: hypothetical protein M3P18_08595 [Actinomycetota bacterium]|nr:hypothetical protein [Actinomycetota bacterium]
MSVRDKLVALFIAALAITAPAAVLRGICAANACRPVANAATKVPFCSLAPDVKRRIVKGYRDGRSPDLLAITERAAVGVNADGVASAWPSLHSPKPAVPIGFYGYGVSHGRRIPPGTTLDAVAPTIAEILGIRRPHPQVRSGHALEGVASGSRPRLVLEIVGKGIAGGRLRSIQARHRRSLWTRMRSGGAVTFAADPGSLPLDPAAVLTTIGTGGMPFQHGITGTRIRNDQGKVVPAWGPGAPVSVIAALGDDLDHQMHQRPLVGMVALNRSDRGVIGGNWYVGHDRDDVRIISRKGTPRALERAEERAVHGLLRRGYGADATPDLLAVVLDVRASAFTNSLARLYDAARTAAHGRAALVVTATGAEHARSPIRASTVVRRLDHDLHGDPQVVAARAVGGLFLRQRTLSQNSLSDAGAARILERQRLGGRALFADVFPSIAVSFARYC